MLSLISAKTPRSFSAELLPVLLQGTVPSYMQYFTFVLVEFHKVPITPFLQPYSSTPGGPTQFGVIWNLDESVLFCLSKYKHVTLLVLTLCIGIG